MTKQEAQEILDKKYPNDTVEIYTQIDDKILFLLDADRRDDHPVDSHIRYIDSDGNIFRIHARKLFMDD